MIFCEDLQRRDRMYKNGGDVLIAVKKSIPAVLITFSEPVAVEFFYVSLFW